MDKQKGDIPFCLYFSFVDFTTQHNIRGPASRNEITIVVTLKKRKTRWEEGKERKEGLHSSFINSYDAMMVFGGGGVLNLEFLSHTILPSPLPSSPSVSPRK